MVRPLPVVAGFVIAVIALASAAPAEEPPGRFQIAPGEAGGFVRLDTRTGAVSHCGKRDGAWYCEPLAGSDSGLEAKVAALSTEVSRLTKEVSRLSAEVQALTAHSGAPPAAPSVAEDDRKTDEAIGFAEKVMRRFFDLVREMKREAPDRI